MRRHDAFVPEESKTRRPDPFVPAVIDICRKPSKCITMSIHFRVCYSRRGGAARLALMRSDTLIFPNRAHRRSDTLFFSNRAQRRSDTLFWPVHAQMGSDHHILNPPCPAGPEWVGGAHFPLGLEIEIGQKDRTTLHNRPAVVGRAEEQLSPAAVTGPGIIGSATRYATQYGIRTEWRAAVAPKGATTQ